MKTKRERRLRSKVHHRLRMRDHQVERFKKDHERGHARAARRDAGAVRFLRRLLGVEVKREKKAEAAAPKVMFDSVDLSQIPPKAQVVLGYVNGAWPTFPEVVKRWPHAQHLSMAVTADAKARGLDIETGDATPEEAPKWVREALAENPHERPVLYASVSLMPTVVFFLAHAGIRGDEVILITAHYTFEAHICGPKSCGQISFEVNGGTQWTDTALGRNLDESRLTPHVFAEG